MRQARPSGVQALAFFTHTGSFSLAARPDSSRPPDMDKPSPCNPDSTSPSAPVDRRLLLGAVGLAGVAALSAGRAKAAGGPLNPPAGAVSPTGKTLAEIEPRTATLATTDPHANFSI
jgi:hypothetical protein